MPASAASLPADHATQMAKGLDLFKSSVRQVMLDACLKCHGGDKTKGDFDLSSREALMRGGHSGAAIVPGDSASSYMMKLLRHEDDPHMPQKADKLPADVIAKFAAWIDAGAPYDKPLVASALPAGVKKPLVVTDEDRKFWSFIPLAASVHVPAVQDERWGRTPVDRFVLAKLEEKGLEPNGPASKRTLIRRAYLDLLGLPPTPEAIEAFVADTRTDAYERLVESLLNNPHFGERWARHWLDLARFAESHGFEHDYDRPYAYHYRDFVIRAFNDDLPFDTFVKWQLAGDELEPKNPMALMATGFLGAGVFPTQITKNEVERTRYDAMDDMLGTTGTAMLGLTIGCARCHDHKYDPIPTADYYRMVSAFTTTVRSEVDLDLGSDGEYDNAKRKWDAEQAALLAAQADHEKRITPAFETWLDQHASAASAQAPWLILDSVTAKSTSDKTVIKKLEDGSLLFTGDNPNQPVYTLTFRTTARHITAVRLDALTDPSLPKKGPGRARNGNFALTDFTVTTAPTKDPKAKPQPAKLVTARATHEQNSGELSVKGSIDEFYSTGWAVDFGGIGKDQTAVFGFEKPIDGFDGGTTLTFTFKFMNNVQHALGRPRLSITTEDGEVGFAEPDQPQHVAEAFAALKQSGKAGLTAAHRAALLRLFAADDATWRDLNAKLAAHTAAEPQRKLVKVQICSDGRVVKPMRHHTQGADFFETTYYLNRGDCDQKNGEAPLGFMQVLERKPEASWRIAPPKDAKLDYKRSSLANWMTDTTGGAGSLLARVIVNRLWQHYFGRGIVATPSDFGTQGAPPSHPELLEYLAGELVSHRWSLKHIHRLILTSSVYTQSSDADAARAKTDPDNQLLWRFAPRRLEAEAIRDSVLAVTGELDATMFGPGTLDESMKRRSIYFTVKRSKLIPSLRLFDWPEALVGVAARSSTTVAPQALMFMNNDQVRGWATSFGNRLAPAAERSISAAVKQAYELALGRSPEPAEVAASVAFIEQQASTYAASKPAEAKKLALADFAQAVLSVNEFIYVQ
jgi:cytochrome c553